MLDTLARPVGAPTGPEIFSSSDTAMLLRDPATFALCNHLVSRSYWNLHELFDSVPDEFQDLLQQLIDHLARSGVVERSGGGIILSKNYVSSRNLDLLQGFLPKVMGIASSSVIKLAAQKGDPRALGETADFLGIPEDAESVRETRAATIEFLAKLRMIQAKAMSRNSEGRPMRFVGLVSYQIRLGDFV